MCLNLYYTTKFFFFFQAEDGIRDVAVTGVQTCALPIAFLDATTTGEAIDEVRAEQPLERVAGRDRHGARYRARGAEVHQKRTHHDGRPDVVPDEQQGGKPDPRRRPHGRRVGV